MPILADTSILLRGAQRSHSMHEIARTAVENLLARGEVISVLPQNLIEFWAVATRPAARSGLGMTRDEAEAELNRLESQFELLPDVDGVYQEWRRLVSAHNVVGVAVYDARIAATMLMQGVSHILPFDVDGFRRFPGIQVMHPGEVDRSPAAENVS